MKVQEIKNIAKRMHIKTGKMKKADIIKTIQIQEGNWPCFETAQHYCDQYYCLWRNDCLH